MEHEVKCQASSKNKSISLWYQSVENPPKLVKGVRSQDTKKKSSIVLLDGMTPTFPIDNLDALKKFSGVHPSTTVKRGMGLLEIEHALLYLENKRKWSLSSTPKVHINRRSRKAQSRIEGKACVKILFVDLTLPP